MPKTTAEASMVSPCLLPCTATNAPTFRAAALEAAAVRDFAETTLNVVAPE